MNYEYYYNNVPKHGLCRNNLNNTSIISNDTKKFVQWYYNDSDYHLGQNQVIDPSKMEEKWLREVKFLTIMNEKFPNLIPCILDIDEKNKKIYLEIDGVDFWEQSNCSIKNYSNVLQDWHEQMINIIQSHKSIGIFKYSMHPSSYFIVKGKLKSINYFFSYHKDEPCFSIKDVESHIYSTRQQELKKYVEYLGIEWNKPQSFELMNKLCWNSFRTNYPDCFIEEALNV